MVQIWVTNRLKKNFLNKRERMSGERRKPSVSTNRNAFHSHVFHPGVFGFAEMLSYVWFSKPASNPGLTRQPHGLCAFSLLFFPFPFFFLLFVFNFTLECSLPRISWFCPQLLGHLCSWPGGAGLLTESATLSCGLMRMRWPSLAQSTPLGDAGQDLLCRGWEQRTACCSFDH